MDFGLKILILAALTLLVSGFGNYRSLNNDLQTQIDKALDRAHKEIAKRQHVAFHSLEGEPKLQGNSLYVHVLLQITTCPKTSNSAYEHRDECFTRKEKTPLIDCLVCKNKDGKDLVNCGMRHEVMKKWPHERNNCHTHFYGSKVAFQKFDDNKEIGCVGCL
ncbi:cystatin-like protein [Silurus meridionalis]|uniref:cystatin-like protein n=1 Tax=Silurus meridionalis TaxID=175797 RepID=UPI001EEA396D|nr:cystatin-like protein [Silurus meridionalis]